MEAKKKSSRNGSRHWSEWYLFLYNEYCIFICMILIVNQCDF